MSTKWLLATSLVLAGLVAIMVVQLTSDETSRVERVPQSERHPFDEVESDQVARIELRRGDTGITLVRKTLRGESYFGIVERGGFPADGVEISRMLDQLLGMTLIEQVEGGLERFGLEGAEAVDLTLLDADGEELQSCVLGRRSGEGMFVLVDDKAYQAREAVELFSASELLNLAFPSLATSPIEEVRFRFPRRGSEPVYAMKREAPGASLAFTDEVLGDATAAIQLPRAMRVERLVQINPAAAGLDTPAQVVTYDIEGGSKLTLSLGNVLPFEEEDEARRRYLQVDFELGELTPELKPILLEWGKRGQGHVLLLEDSQEFALLNFKAPAFIDYQPDDLERIVLSRGEDEVRLEQEDGRWMVRNGYDFPADPKKMEPLLSGLGKIEIRPGDVANPSVDAEELLGPAEKRTTMTIVYAGGRKQTLVQGKNKGGAMTPGRQPEPSLDAVSERSDQQGAYLKLPSGQLVLGGPMPWLNPTPRHYLERQLARLPDTQVQALKVTDGDKTVVWEKEGDSPELTEASREAHGEIEKRFVLENLRNLQATDVVKPAEEAVLQAFESQPITATVNVTATTGLVIELKLRGTDEEGYRLGAVSASYQAPAEGEVDAEVQSQAQRLQQAYAGRVVRWSAEAANKFYLFEIERPQPTLDELSAITVLADEKPLLAFESTEDGWTLGDGYADEKKLGELLEDLNELTLKSSALTTNDEPVAHRVELMRKEGGPLVYTVSKELERKNKWGSDGQFIWVGFDGAEGRQLVAARSVSLDTDPAEWEDQKLVRLTGEKLERVEVKSPTRGLGYELVRQDGELVLADLGEDESMLVKPTGPVEQLLEKLIRENLKEKSDDLELTETIVLHGRGGQARLHLSDVDEKPLSVGIELIDLPDADELNELLEGKVVEISSPGIAQIFKPREELASRTVKTSHILVAWQGATRSQAERSKDEARKLAEEVLAKVKAEGSDFAALAGEYSDEPGAADRGGKLSMPITSATTGLAEEYKQAALELEVGEVTDLVETEFGFHIIRRDE